MKIYEACCYAILTITITGSCVQAEPQYFKHEIRLSDKKPKKGALAKRDAFLMLEHFPVHWVKQYPKFINSGVGKQRNVSPKPRHAITRTKFTVKPSRKIVRWHRNSLNPKYGEPNRYKRPPKLRYAHQKSSYRPRFHPLKRRPQFFNTPEPGGFGEPPRPMLDYPNPETSYGEPPFRVALQHPVDFSEPIDVKLEDSETRFRRPYKENPEERPYFDFFNYDRPMKIGSRKKPNGAGAVVVTWAPESEAESQIVVGGRYAEPPARYFSHFDQDGAMRHDDVEYAPHEEVVEREVISATVSPYVNYKNSNVAFSPQDLNDAFSLNEKE